MASKRKPRNRRAKGTGSIYENKDGSFTAALDVNDKLIRRRAPDRPTAERKLAELIELRRRDINIGSGEQAVTAWLESWYAQVATHRDISTRTKEFYLSMIEQYIIPKIGTMRICDVRADHLQLLINEICTGVQRRAEKRGQSHDGVRTARGAAGVLSEAFALAKQRKYITDNPMEGVLLPKHTPKEITPLTDAQLTAFLKAVTEQRQEALWYCYVLLGIRRGEGLGLRWSGLDWDAATLRIDSQVQVEEDGPTIVSRTKTRAGRRVLPVPRILLDLLHTHWQQQQVERTKKDTNWTEHGLIFPSNVGTPLWPHNLEKLFYEARKRANLPDTITLHYLRHTLATLLDEAGASESLKSGILGHGARTITQHYTKARIEAMRKVIEAVADRIQGESREAKQSLR
jgi:integrase